MDNATIMSESPHTRYHVDEFNGLVALIQRRFARFQSEGPIFVTDCGDKLWNIYINSFPEEDRQYHNCSACRHFMRRFGGLVHVNPETGVQKSAVWPNAVDSQEMQYYGTAVEALRKIVNKSEITGVFLTGVPALGENVTGDWTHFALRSAHIWQNPVLTARQRMALKREHYKNVSSFLADYEYPTDFTKVGQLVTSNQLFRGETVKPALDWLFTLQSRRTQTKNSKSRKNITWAAIATAPDSVCSPRSSMIGTLFADVAAGLAFEDIKARFDAKMRPDLYQRPQAPPKAGNIEVAEKLVTELGITASLQRRRATHADIIVEPIWTPINKETKSNGGVFGHLKKTDVDVGFNINRATTMTWVKFADQVLPAAESIDFLVEPHTNYGKFIGLTTAVDPEAPPILFWDKPEARNPVSWYTYMRRNTPGDWNLNSGPVKVTSIIPGPLTWRDPDLRHEFSRMVILLLAGMKDLREPGMALFPQMLKPELRSVRSTIEAHSAASKLGASPDGTQACGVMLISSITDYNCVLRVTNQFGSLLYNIDRWD